MAGSSRQPDYDALAVLLKAIAYPVRLELLDHLRTPKAAKELRLHPRRTSDGAHSERPAARQTVLKHLETLKEASLVRTEPALEARGATRYVVNPLRLYALVEELRHIIIHHVDNDPDEDETNTVVNPRPVRRYTGPRLVLVHGIYEGQVYPLEEDGSKGPSWSIGRSEEHAVNLHYDPFVSHENAVIGRGEAGFIVTDLGSKNGTYLNWQALRPGRPAPLVPGDVIGVGRSLLVFAG